MSVSLVDSAWDSNTFALRLLCAAHNPGTDSDSPKIPTAKREKKRPRQLPQRVENSSLKGRQPASSAKERHLHFQSSRSCFKAVPPTDTNAYLQRPTPCKTIWLFATQKSSAIFCPSSDNLGQVSVFPFDLLSLFQDLLFAPEVDVGGYQVSKALVVALVVVMFDEGTDLALEISGQ